MSEIISDYDEYQANRVDKQNRLNELTVVLGSRRQQTLKAKGIITGTQYNFNYLNEQEHFVSLIESGKEDEFFDIIKKKKQGGFSDEIFATKYMKQYAKNNLGHLCGYFHAKEGFRTKEIDEYLENGLKKIGKNAEEIAKYLAMKDTRQLVEAYTIQDNIDIHDEKSKKEFIDEYIMVPHPSSNL